MKPVWPEVDRNTIEEVEGALKSRRWAIAQSGEEGSYIDAAEEKLAGYFGVKHAITTCNGSAAIVIALQALEIGPGDSVIVPASTWLGCVTSVLRVGACPILVDASSNTPLMSMDFNQTVNIKAILAVHLYNHALDIEAIKQKFWGVPVIEDSSHNFFVSEQADITICSLQATKVLTCGEGGVAFTNDDSLARRMEALRADGRHRNENELNGVRPTTLLGANYAMSEISAALLIDQLRRYPNQNRRRRIGLNSVCKEFDYVRAAVVNSTNFSGSFHGVAIKTPNPKRILNQFDPSKFGFHLSRAYPAIPDYLQFYDPKIFYPLVDFVVPSGLVNSRRFYENTVIIPHEAFLDPDLEFFNELGKLL